MNKAIIGRKLGMSRHFTAEGLAVPVTVIEAGPCPVVQVKSVEHDGYKAVRMGFDTVRDNLLNKPDSGVFKKAGVKPARILREFRLDNSETYEIGKEVKADVFAAGDMVDVSGLTRGRGYAGIIERWNGHRLFMSHGNGPNHRQSGSMGSNTTPAHTLPGKHMPGQYGHENVTIVNLQVVKVDAERGVLLVKGAIPGPKGGFVTVRSAVKTQL